MASVAEDESWVMDAEELIELSTDDDGAALGEETIFEEADGVGDGVGDGVEDVVTEEDVADWIDDDETEEQRPKQSPKLEPAQRYPFAVPQLPSGEMFGDTDGVAEGEDGEAEEMTVRDVTVGEDAKVDDTVIDDETVVRRVEA
ncbi:Nn.00g065910.m01.CDS01 [Neocucurbitaria sp. VM-36]